MNKRKRATSLAQRRLAGLESEDGELSLARPQRKEVSPMGMDGVGKEQGARVEDRPRAFDGERARPLERGEARRGQPHPCQDLLPPSPPRFEPACQLPGGCLVTFAGRGDQSGQRLIVGEVGAPQLALELL